MNKKHPFAGRERGDRCVKGLTPPFHDGRDIKSYRSDGSMSPDEQAKQNVREAFELTQDMVEKLHLTQGFSLTFIEKTRESMLA